MGKTFSTGSLTNAIFQDASNNIGIGGAANASYKFQVTGATNLTAALTGTSLGLSSYLTAVAPSDIFYGMQIYGANGGARKIFVAGQTGFANGLTVDYNGSAFVYAFNEGNVLIGSTSDIAGRIQSKTTGNGLSYSNSAFLYDSSTYGNGLLISHLDGITRLMSTYVGTGIDSNLTFWTTQSNGNQAERMRITSGGIGIGTLGPNNLLSVRGNLDLGATGYSYAGPSQYGGVVFPRGQILFSNTNTQNQLYLSTNAYTNAGGVFAYRNSSQPATAIGLDNGGIVFLTAGNGTADANISFTTAIGISNAGYVTKPSNPAFRAYYSVNGFWNLNNLDIFVFDLTEYNVGGCYNTSTGRFTAPVAGVYQFNFYSIVYGAITNGAVTFRKNGGTPTSGHNVHFSSSVAGAWSNVVYTTSLYLNAGDYVYMQNSGGYTQFHGDDWSSFSGYLVG